jgi:hypothetical protein
MPQEVIHHIRNILRSGVIKLTIITAWRYRGDRRMSQQAC